MPPQLSLHSRVHYVEWGAGRSRQGRIRSTALHQLARKETVNWPISTMIINIVGLLALHEGTNRYLHPFFLVFAGHSATPIDSCVSLELWLSISKEYYVPKLQLARHLSYTAPREILPPKSGSCTRGARTVRLGAFEEALRSLLSHLAPPETAWYTADLLISTKRSRS